MGLVPCKFCGEMISDLATTCPKCGAPVESSSPRHAPADTSRVDMFIATHAKDLPEAHLPLIRQKLLAMDPEKVTQLNLLQFKSPTTLLIISILLGSFGIDRFMLGEVGLGILKLITCGGCGIWTIIDWFSITEKTRMANYQKIQLYL